MSDKTATLIAHLSALAASTTYPSERTVALAHVTRLEAQARTQARAFAAYSWAASMGAPSTSTFTAWF
jgi:hypothetical protein